ncbi:hypothetical protein E2605_18680 [Dysgonomonas capnocytophagoides]|uniref:Uncharacterized protein n=1 Tax=Dysgonomonas capnocytophagoides TaxID=45254 RepID=A0A4Y8KTU8_9BACT|nr:hypothetical protein [Dysgonomonas capnocytophagoides]TFD92586.1 hypothetical protein E2605_18680 [Dysgonomonas capnocytophagoides]
MKNEILDEALRLLSESTEEEIRRNNPPERTRLINTSMPCVSFHPDSQRPIAYLDDIVVDRAAFEHAKSLVSKKHSDINTPSARNDINCIIADFRLGASFVFKHLTCWISVLQILPEECPDLLRSHIPDVECTEKVLVKTNTGSVIEASRVKSAIDPKIWKWCGGFTGEEIMSWMPLYK